MDQAICPECSAAFTLRQKSQLFCCADHRTAWHNRWTKRGRSLVELLVVARVTRGGSRPNAPAFSTRASQDADLLIAKHQREDREAGRMDLREYVTRRYTAGHGSL